MINLAQRLEKFDSTHFREVFHRLQTIDNPLDLSVGIPEELTPGHIKQAGIHAIEHDHTVYTPAGGTKELRTAVATKLATNNSLNTVLEQVTIVPGLTTGLLLVYLALLDPDDEVIVLDPYYPPYVSLAEMIGARPVVIPTYPTFQPDMAAIAAAVSAKTKAIIINSPNNPTGVTYSQVQIGQIASIADEHNLLVISDEIYEDYCYDQPHFSIGSIYPNTVTMGGFSKGYAMTGWRLGYIAGPAEFVESINVLQQYVVFSSSSIAQHAALAALEHKPKLLERYRHKRDYIKKELETIGYNVAGANGAYYVFVQTPGGVPDTDFVEQAAEHRLVVIPGRAFSSHTNYIRISYGATMSTIQSGMEVLAKMSHFHDQ
jgi:aspartate aminotransferase/aminotransferase